MFFWFFIVFCKIDFMYACLAQPPQALLCADFAGLSRQAHKMLAARFRHVATTTAWRFTGSEAWGYPWLSLG